jgi:hypothetical protein
LSFSDVSAVTAAASATFEQCLEYRVDCLSGRQCVNVSGDLVRGLWVQAWRFVLEEVAEPVDVGGICAEVIAARHLGTLLGIGGVFPAICPEPTASRQEWIREREV